MTFAPTSPFAVVDCFGATIYVWHDADGWAYRCGSGAEMESEGSFDSLDDLKRELSDRVTEWPR